MPVRRYELGDAPAISVLFEQAIRTIGAVHYSPEQIRVWAARTPSPEQFHARASDGRITWVAVGAQDQAFAVIDLEADGHMDLFYCAPERAGQGHTRLLYATLEAEARARGMTRLYSEASEAALRFFTRQGFEVLHRRDLVLEGVAIHNFAVEKQLG